MNFALWKPITNLYDYKVTAAPRARTSNVADVMPDFLEGLVSIFRDTLQ
jgi:hypothetical protein